MPRGPKRPCTRGGATTFFERRPLPDFLPVSKALMSVHEAPFCIPLFFLPSISASLPVFWRHLLCISRTAQCPGLTPNEACGRGTGASCPLSAPHSHIVASSFLQRLPGSLDSAGVSHGRALHPHLPGVFCLIEVSGLSITSFLLVGCLGWFLASGSGPATPPRSGKATGCLPAPALNDGLVAPAEATERIRFPESVGKSAVIDG